MKIQTTMKQLTFFLLILMTFCCYGKEKTKENPISDFKRIQIGINFSPDICFRTIKNNDGSSFSELVVEQRNIRETVKFGYSTGFNICYNIKKFVGLETGIQYSNKGYKTKKQDLIFGPSDPSLPNQSELIYNYHYIDIPIKVNFTIGKKKVRFFSSIGLTTNIFIKETVTNILYYSDRKDKQKSPTNFDYNKVNISPTVSVGFDYKINSRMNLRVEPTFRYGVLKITKTPVTGYLYSGGLNVSYYFGL